MRSPSADWRPSLGAAGALTVVGTLAVAFAGLCTVQVLREPAVSPGEPASGGQLNQQ
ncbi:hypothetical protein [Nocardiopsis ganjiahuensis]|uniref:hypothetical protein n=1 Tax=Nocardiopsis ganjiahuensis TaxID=239984 RepID=UPI00034614B1